ncbi:MBL fold metallo-hydrolase [Natronomonas salsuginis]|uniref:MBL fold metallo-hydrolase n=1 Tax=Natronomonas salsuginis TaxID=2217661 RepID=A0A4U5JIY7_9EURY|nr:MBL fold metallo-hydrolase [Natronomonas salsuginis]TKR27687.1 MBL fold metallo-hydrolase [Natronomonas salsuginis]
MNQRSREGSIHRLEFDVEWPPGHVACYLVDGPEPVLVDAAMPQSDDALEAALSEHGRSLAEIDHVLITHPHVDHIGGVPNVLGATGATVHAPASVRERFKRASDALGERVRRNCVDAGFSGERLETLVEMAVRSLDRNAELLPPEAVDVWIEPGDSTSVGGITVDAVHLPGHQADHLSYPAELGGERALFAGDMGILPFRPVVVHDGLDDGYRDAFAAFYTALERLAEVDVDRVYPGHGPVHSDLADVVDHHRSSLDHRLDRLVDLVADGVETAPSLARTVAGECDVNYLIPETMSALAHLEATGRLESDSTDESRRYHT